MAICWDRIFEIKKVAFVQATRLRDCMARQRISNRHKEMRAGGCTARNSASRSGNM